MKIKSKYDYQKVAPREELHTTINENMGLQLRMFSAIHKQPMGKIIDILIADLVRKNPNDLNEFLNKVKNYDVNIK